MLCIQCDYGFKLDPATNLKIDSTDSVVLSNQLIAQIHLLIT